MRENKEFEKSLKEKIVKEKQRYSDLLEQYKQLQNIQPVDQPPEVSLDTSQQEEDESLYKQEELQSSPLQVLDEETQTELTKLQLIMENVNTSFEKVETIMKYWSEKVTIYRKVKIFDEQNFCGFHDLLLIHVCFSTNCL